MSRTIRAKSKRTHDRKSCPWCQENLHHKHRRMMKDQAPFSVFPCCHQPSNVDGHADDCENK